ncbi:hypothetical protein [Pilimelia terevasa]|uniref:hypothetical protein n=1 Tax=Pilimelia terevasa TaxID=53372 RepID=UPI00166D99B9|nr:hypothetical protein [Pilimelia terevasa]
MIARFAQVRADLAVRYGAQSQAVTFLLYEELVSMRRLLADDSRCAVVARRVGELGPAIQSRFDTAGVLGAERVLHRTVATGPTVIEFDRDHFERAYRARLGASGRRAVAVTDRAAALRVLRLGASYLYVVDEEGVLLVWPEPRDVADLTFGWAPGGPRPADRVVHPMLVPERLRATAAGELVVVGSPRCVFVVANLKSGHFRPGSECAAQVRSAAMRALRIDDPAGIDVFTLPQATAA